VGDSPAAASPRALIDRRELAFIAVERTLMPMMVSDPRQADNPIVLANKAFLDLTGYGSNEVLGRNCRFLQGPETDPAAVAEIRAGLAENAEVNVELMNHRRDGSLFWNRLRISPIHDDRGRLIYHFASQFDATEQLKLERLEAAERRLLREIDHRAMNVLAIVEGIVRLSKSEDSARYAASVQRRVQALARAHAVLAERGWRDVPLAQLIGVQFDALGGRGAQLDGPEVLLNGQMVQPLSLVFHELASNAVAHGALSRESGAVRIAWSRDAAGAIDLAWREEGGPPPQVDPPSGFGATMIHSIIHRQLRGRVERNWRPAGLHARLTIPMAAAA